MEAMFGGVDESKSATSAGFSLSSSQSHISSHARIVLGKSVRPNGETITTSAFLAALAAAFRASRIPSTSKDEICSSRTVESYPISADESFARRKTSWVH